MFLNRIQEENDFLLAKALQENEIEEARRNRATVSIQRSNYSSLSSGCACAQLAGHQKQSSISIYIYIYIFLADGYNI